jgi:predicted hotdog family 3-hydroxylacyl-ACP dehydratase
MSLGRREIAGLIPQAGDMMLLDRVVHWSANAVTCETEAHHRCDNPLRRGDMLPATAGVEIAAQAMAIHGGLTRGQGGRRGLLGSLRDVQLHAGRLDDIAGPLTVTAELLGGGDSACVYSFRIHGEDRLLLAGRAGVFFR